MKITGEQLVSSGSSAKTGHIYVNVTVREGMKEVSLKQNFSMEGVTTHNSYYKFNLISAGGNASSISDR
jgi:hypothetical protein